VFLSFGLALFWALAAGLARRFGADAQCAVLFAVLLALAELARGWVLTGFPWALLGHIWIDTPAAQLAAWIGPNGLTLLTVVVAVLPVMLRWRGLAAGAVVLVAAFGIGTWQRAQPMPVANDAPMIRLVQPNAEQHLKWDGDLARDHFQRLLDLSAVAPDDGMMPPDLIVWPETSVPYLLTPEETDLLKAIAGSGQGAQMAIGVQRSNSENRFLGYNSLALISPAARLTASYDKHHLVPFGEYIPFGNLMYRWFGLSAFASQMGNGYSAGRGPALLDLGPKLGQALPLICYEAVFPQDLRVPERARFILQITNDAWFGHMTGPWQHLAQARLRAIEQGLPFLRSANTGVSAVIDARGRVLAQLPMGRMGHLDTPLPASLPPTLYARTGDLPILLLLIGLAALLVISPQRHWG
jgi:apolipoprotein N-acyltransferase